MVYILRIYLKDFIANPQMKKIILLLVMLILVKSVVSTLEITEVMYDPSICTDTRCEWFEIYNPGDSDINLNKCMVNGRNLTGELSPAEYLILARNKQNVSYFFNVSETIILEHTFSLANAGGTIIVTGAENCVDAFNYTSYAAFADGNNKTLEKNQEGVWKESLIDGGTPGKENSVREISSERAGNDNESDEISQEGLSQESVNVTLSAISCDIDLNIKVLNQTLVYENGQSLKFKPVLNNKSFPFVIEYWIEDLFGKAVKNQLNTTNTNKKSWKTNIEEEDRVFFIKAVVYPGCNDTNETNNVAEEMFVVMKKNRGEISSSSTAEGNSTLNITETNPQTAHFGEVIMVDIEAYKGSTNKYSLSAWVEKEGKVISEKTKFHLKTKNTFYKLALPVQIKPNCNAKIEDGTATLIVEGLGTSTEKELEIEGMSKDVCRESTVYVEKKEMEKTAGKKKNVFTILDLPAEIHPGEAVRVKVQAQSKDDAEYKVWSYLYRGNKCYSCFSGEREDNAVLFSVDENEVEVAEMLVKADQDLEEGEYTLMVKYKKDGQKTVKSITQKMYVQKRTETKAANQTVPLLSSSGNTPSAFVSEKIQKKELPGYDGLVVYESNSAHSQNIIPYVLFVAFGLLSLVLVIFKRNT